jgi:hypothetical protein
LKLLRKLLKLSNTAFQNLQSLPVLTNLIERAGLRPKYTTNSSERYSLEIHSLAELVDIFYTCQASDPRNKIYTLLGISSDNPGKADLQPDYTISWEELFQKLIQFILSNNIVINTFDPRPAIKSKGYILGQVFSVRSDNGQSVKIISKNTAWSSRE